MKTSLMVLTTLLMTVGPTAATVIFNDGGTHDIDYAVEDIEVRNGTTVNVLPGADIEAGVQGPGVFVTEESTLNVFGGDIKGYQASSFGGDGVLVAWGSATISGGTIQNGGSRSALRVSPAGSAVVSGGTFLGTTTANGDLTVSGGSFEGEFALRVFNAANVMITGGDFVGTAQHVIRYENIFAGASLTILGGTFEAPPLFGLFAQGPGPSVVGELAISGGSFTSLGGFPARWTCQFLTATITGSGLDWDRDGGTSGPLTGSLANGDALNVTLSSLTPDSVVLQGPVSIEAKTWSEVKAKHR